MASAKKLTVDTPADRSRVSQTPISQKQEERNNLAPVNSAQQEPHYVMTKFIPSSRPSSRPSTARSSATAASATTTATTTSSVPNSDYVIISSYLRNSICYGHPVTRGSHSKSVHNGDIFKQHFESVALDQQRRSQSFRRKKDWLGRWTEANIVRDRLLKSIGETQKKTTSSGAS